MRLMMTLSADMAHNADAISAYLATERVNLLGFEQLLDEGATITEHGDAPAVVERDISPLRALWIVDVPSRAAAVELAKNAPGGDGTLEVRESFTPQDFGVPPDPDPPAPSPPPVRKPDTHRYIAFIRSHAEEKMARRFILDGPFSESKELVGGYMIVQVRTLDEAVDAVRPWLRIHREGQGVDRATIEVRRLL